MDKGKKTVVGNLAKEIKQAGAGKEVKDAGPQMLTETQKKLAKSIFAKYDLKKLLPIQAKEILQALEKGGIRAGALNAALTEAGLDPKKFMALVANAGLQPPKKENLQAK